MTQFSPVVIFAYRRPEHLKRLLSSLSANAEAGETELYIYVDGPSSPADRSANEEVRRIASSVTGFASVHCMFSDTNKGLAQSVISGVGSLFEQYESLIVLEDDLYLSCSFLKCMNMMLRQYSDDRRIMQVTGFSTSLGRSWKTSADVYLNRRAESWSWGTWKDRWETIDWTARDYTLLKKNPLLRLRFNSIGSDLSTMLEDSLTGKKSSWAAKFCWSMFRQGRYTLCPVRSLVRNNGFDVSATNSRGYDRYRVDFVEQWDDFNLPDKIEYDRKTDRRANRFWTVPARIWGRMRSI